MPGASESCPLSKAPGKEVIVETKVKVKI